MPTRKMVMEKKDVQSVIFVSLGGLLVIGAVLLATRQKETLLVAEA